MDLKPAVYAHCVDDDLRRSTRCAAVSLGAPPHAALRSRGRILVPDHSSAAPWETTVICEIRQGLHEGAHAGSARGRCAGPTLARTSVSYLKDLGITAVELLPIHAKCDETLPHRTGRCETTGLLDASSSSAPEPSCATAESRARGARAVDEVPAWSPCCIRRASGASSSVVYNHDAGAGTPARRSWRGLGSTCTTAIRPASSDHRRDRHRRRWYGPPRPSRWIHRTPCATGCATCRRGRVCFDIAATGFGPMHPLSSRWQRTISSPAKLIAEPWGCGSQAGRPATSRCPSPKWNDHYRGALRNFWLADVRP